jgi:hypothetical protein
MSDPLRVQLSGPLWVFAAGFLEELLGRGYRGLLPAGVDGSGRVGL